MKLRFALIACLFATAPSLADDTIKGEAMARDAVTIAVGGARFRLEAILPPEDNKICGAIACAEAAKNDLATFIAGQNVVCSKSRKLGHGFFLGKCRIESGGDLGLYLLSQGLALPDSDASGDYRAASSEAKAGKKGMWASSS